MKLAILLQHYFPYGGLQRDAIRLAKAAMETGDSPTLIVSSWEGAKPEKLPIIELHSGGRSNHGKAARFARACQPILTGNDYDTAICFSRVPNTPFHFCGDASFLERFNSTKPALTRYLPRYRFFLNNERALFGPESSTHIFFLALREIETYRRLYKLPKPRITPLPPWLTPAPSHDSPSRKKIRNDLFSKLNIPPESQLLLFVGSNFKLKRLDVIIKALPKLPASFHLAICGQDTFTPYQKIAQTSDVLPRIHFMGPQDDIPQWMRAADLLIHPSDRETAGMVLVEAQTYGLPVICTDACGYAPYVKEAGGTLIPTPARPDDIVHAVDTMLPELPKLQKKALLWASHPERYRTAHLILQTMRDSLNQTPYTPPAHA
jgi:UDP-glucose:(heptosyl)LPS alpha-1,3-glucosyltransferase